MPSPLGASWDGDGVNFALYSQDADAVELCLVRAAGGEQRIPISSRSGAVWHVYVRGVAPGQLYGYRVHGPYEPKRGLRFNPNVRLLDPYARAVSGAVDYERGVFGYREGSSLEDLERNPNDATGAPLGVVIDPTFDWEGDGPPATSWDRSVLYETHVKGFTRTHPELPDALKGTYSGLTHPAVLKHLSELGITALELLPVHAFIDDQACIARDLKNYWGYGSIGFFAPEARYRSGDELGAEVRQFKQMVKELHRAGLEVILDVVYTHSPEGNHLGPTLSLKGIDNRTYFRLFPAEPRLFRDYTGTGNTLNTPHPQTLALIMDSLRYWVTDMHVDGFRFDLASTLVRGEHAVDPLSRFFTVIHRDPVLSQVKLIAEPWDFGDGGYQVGKFPARWAEWNDRYRDTVRRFWKGEARQVSELASRVTGSSDLYQTPGRLPYSTINLVTSHDGFTLRDLVSYEAKHNDANGEHNADGSNDEVSFNCGVEGETGNPAILALRARQQRNLLATLLLSQGTPMLLGGDEVGRSQRGNNNAYCHDNRVSWYDWELTEERRALFEFTAALVALRKKHRVLRRRQFLEGRPGLEADARDVLWFRADGHPMKRPDWFAPNNHQLCVFLSGCNLPDVADLGESLLDDDFLLLFNGADQPCTFTIPSTIGTHQLWRLVVDTAEPGRNLTAQGGDPLTLPAHALSALRGSGGGNGYPP